MQNTDRSRENPIRLLMLDDSHRDAELVRNELNRGNLPTRISRVESEAAFVSELHEYTPDVVLSDHSLAQFDARSALAILREIRPTTPFILVTGSVNSEAAVAWIRNGAEDLILKSNVSRLATVITDALELRRPLSKLTQRQIEVLRFVVEGKRTSEIARRLEIGVKTVESHRSEIMKRLDIHDIAGLVRYAIRVRLVPLTS